MNITNLKWRTSQQNSLIVTTDLGVFFVSWPTLPTWHREIIKQAIDAGVTIEAADPLLPPTDYSDINNLDKTIKAIGLTIAEVSGKTPIQIRDIFKAKYETL
jgi:hypothetical protein